MKSVTITKKVQIILSWILTKIKINNKAGLFKINLNIFCRSNATLNTMSNDILVTSINRELELIQNRFLNRNNQSNYKFQCRCWM